MKSLAAKVLEELDAVTDERSPADDAAKAGLTTLIGQIERSIASIGFMVNDAMVDVEDQCVCAEILVGGKPVQLYFFIDEEDQQPYLGVDWDNDDDMDSVFDLSDFDVKQDDGMIDVASISQWMPASIMASVLLDQVPGDADGEGPVDLDNDDLEEDDLDDDETDPEDDSDSGEVEA